MPPLRTASAIFIAFVFASISNADPIVGTLAQNGDAAYLESNVVGFYGPESDWTDAVTRIGRINDGAWIYGLMTGDFLGKSYPSGDALDMDPYQWTSSWGNWETPSLNPNHYGADPFKLSFVSTSVTSLITTSNTLFEEGYGVMEMEGFDPTIVSWQISAHTQGFSSVFASVTYTASGEAVYDGGNSITLLGTALVGLALLRRRFVR